MSKREDLLAAHQFVLFVFGGDRSDEAVWLCHEHGAVDAVKRGLSLVDRAIVKASREMRGL